MTTQKLVPLKGVDYDSNELYVDEMKAVFLKNVSNEDDEFVFTPLESNTQYCNITLPAGENYCCGFEYFKEIKRGFVCVWNSLKNHMVYQIDAASGVCTPLVTTPCFNFQLNPLNFTGTGRMALQTTCRFSKVKDAQETVIFLVITDDFNPQLMLCVDDLIATNGFDPVRFPYFQVNDPECANCNIFYLGLPPNRYCVQVDAIQRNLADPAELLKINHINNKAWEFRVMGIDVWGRATEHGPISTRYINSIGGSCVQESTGLPRCLKLTFDAGCPTINKWQIEFRNCNGNIRGLSVESDWFLYDTIDRYDNSTIQDWWQRQLISVSTNFTYNAADNTISYLFCGDKECQPLPVKETGKTTNFLPITSGGVFALGNNIVLDKNTRGFEPLVKSELDKMLITVERPAPVDASCRDNSVRKVIVWGLIWNPFEDYGIPVRKKDDNIVFGIADCANNNPYNFDQVFPKGQEGFPGYMAGGKAVISQQYIYDIQTGTKTLAGTDLSKYINLPQGPQRYFPLQKWEFDLLPGKYLFRVGSHKSSLSDDYEKTSTYVIGITSINNLGAWVHETKELVIDCCEADVEVWREPIMIYDLTRMGKGCAVADVTSVNAGYLYEDEVGRIPIELARVTCHDGGIGGGDQQQCNYTDHNGFYFAATRNRALQTTLHGMKNCVYSDLAVSRKSYDQSLDPDVTLWYRFDILYAYKGTDKYLSTDRAIIQGKIVLCDNPNIGVAGALVLLTNGGSGVTDSQGKYRIVAHDIGNQPYRVGDLLFSQKGTCQLLQCGAGCVHCFPTIPTFVPPCNGLNRVIDVRTVSVRINGYNQKGPHMGGRYGVGIVLHDWLDRQSFVQIADKHYINIPSLQDTQIYGYSKILFGLTGMYFRDEVARVSFYITDNLVEEDYLTWVAERIQFVDNSGRVNNAAPTKIRLYYEGLAEYNKQNDDSTNAVWEFIANTESGSVVTGDEVQFLANGDGTIYPKLISQLVTYDKIGKYIQVAYSAELKDLKDGALIRLVRQKNCVQDEFFYELCPIIPVKNNRATVPAGQVEFFDSYLLNRQIPVPITTTTKTTDANNNEIETSVTVNSLNSYPFLFEHHSPSDFWGDHCGTKGRVNVKNPFETRQCRRTELAMSRALTDDGLLNGLHRYSEEDAVSLGAEWASITACIPALREVMVICENHTLILPFNDANVRTDAEGRVFSPSADDKFGKPQRKSTFGCQAADRNTIRTRNGVVVFLDSNNTALVRNNFSEANDISFGVKKYLSSLCKLNSGSLTTYFHGVIDPKTEKYLLTIATLQGQATEYQNTEEQITPGENDTLVFDYNLPKDNYKGTRSYTPEYYGAMDGEKNDQQLFAFRFGVAWMHHRLDNTGRSFCNFFGVQCFPVLEFVFVKDLTKVKSFKCLENYCRQVLLFADLISTESGQLSRLMPGWWEKRDKFYVADLKCAVNTVTDANMPIETGANALLDGDSLYGRWLRVRLRPRMVEWDRYFEFTAIICSMTGQEKSGEHGN